MKHPSTLLKSAADLAESYRTDLGVLYQGDMLALFQELPHGSLDMVFADPPFNLNKDYGPGISDAMRDHEYLEWSENWLSEAVRVLAPGGALFVFNLPRWCVEYGAFLNRQGMMFRHWIAMRMPKILPIPMRMAAAHYGCLYYTKGKPKTFNKIYTPIQTCRHCGGEVRDYGGHRKKMNPKGVNLMDVWDAPEDTWEDTDGPLPPDAFAWTEATDIWDDIPPVRHSKYKHRQANALAPIMLERLIAMSTNPGDMVFDPFGGTGTTYYAAEKLGRRWIGVELGDTEPTIRRLQDYAAGEYAEWESARGRRPGRGAASQNQIDLLASA
jgi:site-specific DNA-methyltransferase (adenine-specific)